MALKASPNLPIELLQCVLDEIVAEGFPTYGVELEHVDLCPYAIGSAKTAAVQAAMVSHAFRDYLVPRIFFRVCVWSTDRLQTLSLILRSNSSLGKHIKSIDIPVFWTLEDEDKLGGAIDLTALQTLELLLSVLGVLAPTLNELTLQNQSPSFMDVLGVEDVTSPKWVEILSGSSLRALRLQSMLLPHDFLRCLSPHLRFLDIYKCRVRNNLEWTAIADGLTAIHTFGLGTPLNGPPVTTLLAAINTSQVQRLAIHTQFRSRRGWHIQDVLSVCPMLRTIHINIDDRRFARDTDPDWLNMHTLTASGLVENLEVVRYLNMAPNQSSPVGFMPLHSFFSGANTPSNFTTIKIIYRSIRPEYAWNPKPRLLERLQESEKWGEVDEIFTRPHFRSLTQVIIHIGQLRPSVEYGMKVEKAVKGWMPKIHESGYIRVRVALGIDG